MFAIGENKVTLIHKMYYINFMTLEPQFPLF